MNIKIVLFEPEIPQNVGTIMRACACLDLELILIEPLGFILSDRSFKRAKMDYEPNVRIMASVQDFLEEFKDYRKILLTPHTSSSLYDFKFKENDLIIFGRESNGMELSVIQHMDCLLSIPMGERARSLNLAISFSMVCNELFSK